MHWMRVHQDGSEFDHIERMSYRSFVLFQDTWNNAGFCNEFLAAARPDALILLRDQPLGEQKNDLYTDPVTTGNRHADDWANKFQSGQVKIPPDRAYPLGINEPDSNNYQQQINLYTEAFCRRLSQHGLHGGAYGFGEGHPSTVGLRKETMPDWHWYESSHGAVVQGQHLVILHEYGLPNDYGWGYWCNRLSHCPWTDITIVVAECGIDGGVDNSRPGVGWQGYNMTGAEYTHWLDNYMKAIDRRVHSFTPFTWDFDHPWSSFDVKELRDMWEVFPWSEPMAHAEPPPPPVVIDPPTPVQPPPSPQPAGGFDRAMQFILKWEGGYQNNPADLGNWTGQNVGEGENKGTNFGISAHSYPGLDIKNLTREQAIEIYKRDYWNQSGADKLAWPLNLLVFDTAVLHGVGAAQTWLKEVGANPYAFAAKRLNVYTHSPSWSIFGNGWTNRTADLLLEMGK